MSGVKGQYCGFMRIIFLIVVISPIAFGQECTPECVQVNLLDKSCKICYKKCDEIEHFMNCTIKYCAQFNISSRDRICLKYQSPLISSLTKYRCQANCCPDDIASGQYKLEMLQTCRNQIVYTQIAIGVAVLTVLISVMICFCWACQWWKKFKKFQISYECIRKCLREFRSGSGNQAEQNSQLDQSQIGSKDNINQINEQQLWYEDPSTDEIWDKNMPCSICLGINVNVLTKCNHGYHMQCLWDWIKLKYTCPNCVNKQIYPMKFYCRGCLIKYIPIHHQSHRNVRPKARLCSDCQ